MNSSSASAPLVRCPHCKKQIVYSTENPFRPFCCERCKLIDLGAWADESYKVPSNERADEITDGSGDDQDYSNDDDPLH